MPCAVHLLAFSLFAMGSAEFLPAGVLISAFAVGVVIGGPPLAVLTLRRPRWTTLVVSQTMLAIGVAIGLPAGDFTVLIVTRFLCGLAYAGFWAVAAVAGQQPGL
ncbi:MFS transporter [Streptomyces sp. SID10815]|uniref:MFS transporter n=1 Tax=Streptomyces sp. SID10815 TaxID=2706027 RepID=UPI0019449252|nr:MFS transporter [Streptomyces sp. SID10815]